MNKILENQLVEVLQNNPSNLLNIFFTAGYPSLNSTPEVINSLNEAGVDLIEIGIPFSDPLADGPTIQASSSVALKNGMTLKLLFQQLQTIESRAPLLLMGYYNSVLNFGVESFCKSCRESNVSGVVLPDLPFDYFQQHFKQYFEKYGLSAVFLISPTTEESRIREIDAESSSFIYAVSSSSTTGKNKGINTSEEFLSRLAAFNLRTPFLVGFNIKTKEDVQFVNSFGAGAIIGSAFVKALESTNNISKTVHQFINSVKP